MENPGAAPITRLARWGLVVAACALIVWRAPRYLMAPSFWAEDGILFFAGAWNGSMPFGLVQHPSGYLNLYANLSTSLAAELVGTGLVSLTSAPRVTAVAALAAQLAPIVLVAFAVARAWGGAARRAAAIAAVLFGGRTGGMWLNTINSQYFLALAAVVVLLEPEGVHGARRRIHAGIVALAGLSGPVASFVTPLFVWKAARTRTRTAMLLAAVASLCTGFQLYVLALGGAEGLSGRGEGMSGPMLAAIAWRRSVVLPLFGGEVSVEFGRRLYPLLASAGASALALGGLLFAALALLIAILALGVHRQVRWWLAGSYGLVTVGSYLGAVSSVRGLLLGSPENGARYGFVPGVLVLWLLLLNVRPGQRAKSIVCGALFATGIAIGASQWRETVRWRASWPEWSREIAAWERDPREALRIWPPGWTMRLVPRR